MRIGQIKKLVMEEKECVILVGERGQQWIGGKNWIVRVDDDIRINANSLKGLFDITQEQADKIRVQEMAMETYPGYPEMRRDMNQMTPSVLDIGNFGGLVTLEFDGKVFFVQKKFVRAAIVSEDYKEYMLAKNAMNEPLIAIYDGYIMAGVVRPENVFMARNLLKLLGQVGAMIPGGSRTGIQDKVSEDDGEQVSMEDFGTEAAGDGDT